jgi:hypothetical protein
MKEAAGDAQDLPDDTWDDGCTEQDVHYFTQEAPFAVRAVYIVTTFLFPEVCLHDKWMLNGLLTVLASMKPRSLHHVCSELHPRFLRAVLSIFQRAPYIAVTVSTLCGIVVSEIEEFFSPHNSEEEEEGA